MILIIKNTFLYGNSLLKPTAIKALIFKIIIINKLMAHLVQINSINKINHVQLCNGLDMQRYLLSRLTSCAELSTVKEIVNRLTDNN